MKVVYGYCYGIDVHKDIPAVCVMWKHHSREIRLFGTTTANLPEMSDWLQLLGCETVAMESTGTYW